jgi:hypothetical protein
MAKLGMRSVVELVRDLRSRREDDFLFGSNACKLTLPKDVPAALFTTHNFDCRRSLPETVGAVEGLGRVERTDGVSGLPT